MLAQACPLDWRLQFRNPHFESQYMADKAKLHVNSDKYSLIIRTILILGHTLHPELSQFRLGLCILWVNAFFQAWLLWRKQAFWLRHRVAFMVALKIFRTCYVPLVSTALRVDVVSAGSAMQMLLLRSEVLGALISLYAYPTTFTLDVLTQAFHLAVITGMVVHTTRVEGSFCGPGSNQFMTQVYEALPHGLEFLGMGVVGATDCSPGRPVDPCLVLALFAQIFLAGIVPLLMRRDAELRGRYRWLQRQSAQPPPEAAWQLDLCCIIRILAILAAASFSAVTHLACFLQTPVHAAFAPATVVVASPVEARWDT